MEKTELMAFHDEIQKETDLLMKLALEDDSSKRLELVRKAIECNKVINRLYNDVAIAYVRLKFSI